MNEDIGKEIARGIWRDTWIAESKSHPDKVWKVNVSPEEVRMGRWAMERNYGPIIYSYDGKNMLMQKLEGYYDLESLDDRIYRERKEYIAAKLGIYVALMHSDYFTHGDLHPRNVMFNPLTGDIKIIDYSGSKIKSIYPSDYEMDVTCENMMFDDQMRDTFLQYYNSYLNAKN